MFGGLPVCLINVAPDTRVKRDDPTDLLVDHMDELLYLMRGQPHSLTFPQYTIASWLTPYFGAQQYVIAGAAGAYITYPTTSRDNYGMAEAVLDIGVDASGIVKDNTRYYRSLGDHKIVKVDARQPTVLVQAAGWYPGTFEMRAARTTMTTRRPLSAAELIERLSAQLHIGEYGIYRLMIQGEVRVRAAFQHPTTRVYTAEELFRPYVHVNMRGLSFWSGIRVPTEYARNGHLHGENTAQTCGGHLVHIGANAEVMFMGMAPDVIYEQGY